MIKKNARLKTASKNCGEFIRARVNLTRFHGVFSQGGQSVMVDKMNLGAPLIRVRSEVQVLPDPPSSSSNRRVSDDLV